MNSNARSAYRVAILAIALAAVDALEAQVPPTPPSPPAAAQSEAAEAEARLRFEQAVQDQLAAEKAGPEERQELLRRAAAGYSRVLELRPGAVAALYNLGRAQLALGDTQNAAKSFELAASRPGNRQVFYLQYWADYQRDQGRLDDALRAYEQVVLLEPRLDEPHEILKSRYLELIDQNPERLLNYLWRLVAGRQASRAADLALVALEAGWPADFRPELLAGIAASLAQMHGSTEEILSPVDRRLRPFKTAQDIGTGVGELLRLYGPPGNCAGPFGWWNTPPSDVWTHIRGVSRRDALRAALREIGDGYREAAALREITDEDRKAVLRNIKAEDHEAALRKIADEDRKRSEPETQLASACYRAAVDLTGDPDPLALRSLANVYVERSDLGALDKLAAKYADPSGPLFEAKSEAYKLGDLDKILDYHRALGQIYGSLAASGKRGWGTTTEPATALFQLDHAFNIALRLDAQASPTGEPKTTKIDPDLALLYAQGLEATKNQKKGLQVRMEAARRFERAGNVPASQKVLRGINEDSLSPDEQRNLERYRSVRPDPPSALSAKDAQLLTTPAWRESVANVTKPYSNVAMLTHRAAVPAQPVRIEVPATVEWLDTGVDLAAGQSIEFTATGRWSNVGAPFQGAGGFAGYLYPGTIVASAPLAALVARVGDTTFTVGERFAGASPAAGRLFLSINDVGGTFGDNQGAVTVTIEVR